MLKICVFFSYENNGGEYDTTMAVASYKETAASKCGSARERRYIAV